MLGQKTVLPPGTGRYKLPFQWSYMDLFQTERLSRHPRKHQVPLHGDNMILFPDSIADFVWIWSSKNK